MKNKSLRQLIRHYYLNHVPFQRIPDEAFLEILNRHMTDLPEKEIRFFVNEKRFKLMRALIGTELENSVGSILNVACGPFAFENYAPFDKKTEIDGFDMNPLLGGILDDLKQHPQFQNITYECTSAEAFTIKKKYDLVLINDLFYHKMVDFEALIGKFSRQVKPNGLIYFDILDKRSEWLWRALGKDDQFIRYDLSAVGKKLEDLGFKIESVSPALGIGGIVDFTIRAFLYRSMRLANNFVFVARKKSPAK